MEASAYFQFPDRTANFAFADALLVLKDYGLDHEVDALVERWSDVKIPLEAGITKETK